MYLEIRFIYDDFMITSPKYLSRKNALINERSTVTYINKYNR